MLTDDAAASVWITKFVGGVLLWIALVAFAFVSWALYRFASLHLSVSTFVVVVVFIVLVIGFFCLSVGARMFLHRPNRYHSVLSPIGWRILGSLFAVSVPVVLLGLMAAAHKSAQPLSTLGGGVLPLAFVAFLAVKCFVQARVIRRRDIINSGAP
jgi:hypothetical protein